MDNVKKFIAKAHKSADKAISRAQKNASSLDIEPIKEWMFKPIVVKQMYFFGAYVALFLIAMYKLFSF